MNTARVPSSVSRGTQPMRNKARRPSALLPTLSALVGAVWAAGLGWAWGVNAAGGSLWWGMVLSATGCGLAAWGVQRYSQRMRQRLGKERAFFRLLENSVHGLEALFSLEGQMLRVTPSIERLTGRTQAELLADPDLWLELVYEHDRAFCKRALETLKTTGESVSFEIRFLDASGQPFWLACHWQRVINPGVLEGLRLSAENIQSRKEAEFKLLENVAELRRSRSLAEHYLVRSQDERKRLMALLNTLQFGIVFMDRDQRVLYHNQALLDLWGPQLGDNLLGVRAEVLRERCASLLVGADQQVRDEQREKAVALPMMAETSSAHAVEWQLVDGRVLTETHAEIAVSLSGTELGRVWIYEDITERRRTAAQLVQLAEHDPLTNLFNRRRFHEELTRMFANAERRGAQIGLLMFDLDGFKPINDRFGHPAGDEVLIGLAHSVGRVIRRNEVFCRLGGDEFAVLVPDAQHDLLVELARRIVACVAATPFEFDGQSAHVTASLGVAIYPQHAATQEALIAAADQAMYLSKSEGRNRWSLASIAEAGEHAPSVLDNP